MMQDTALLSRALSCAAETESTVWPDDIIHDIVFPVDICVEKTKEQVLLSEVVICGNHLLCSPAAYVATAAAQAAAVVTFQDFSMPSITPTTAVFPDVLLYSTMEPSSLSGSVDVTTERAPPKVPATRSMSTAVIILPYELPSEEERVLLLRNKEDQTQQAEKEEVIADVVLTEKASSAAAAMMITKGDEETFNNASLGLEMESTSKMHAAQPVLPCAPSELPSLAHFQWRSQLLSKLHMQSASPMRRQKQRKVTEALRQKKSFIYGKGNDDNTRKWCSTCNFVILRSNFAKHLRSERHALTCGMPSTKEDAEVRQAYRSKFCDLCNDYVSRSNFSKHVLSKAHRACAKKRRAASKMMK